MEFRAKPEGIHCNGKRLYVRGCSWFGAETNDYTFHGLWAVSWRSLLDFLVTEGYNMIRVPLSVELMENMDTLVPKTINYSANPDLVGKTAGQVMDMVFAECAKRGILLLPDVHRNMSTDGITELWYSPEFPETRLMNAWAKFLKRYRDNPFVFGVDIRNEPHGQASWGGAPENDWASAAERIGNVILREFPEKLIFVEGVQQRNSKSKMAGVGSYWGSVLDSVKERPIKLDLPERVVYSPHFYGPAVFTMPYHQVPDFPRNLAAILDNDFGYITKEKLGCVFIGEVGGTCVSKDETWHEAVAAYIANTPGLVGSIAVWSLNSNSGDTGGLVKDDWKTPESHKLPYYRRMCPFPSKLIDGPAAPPFPTPAPPPLPPPPKAPVVPPKKTDAMSLVVTKKESWKSGEGATSTKYEIDVVNLSATETRLPVVSLSGGLGINSWSCSPLPMAAQGTQKFALPSWLKALGPMQKWSFGMVVSHAPAMVPKFNVSTQ